MGGETQTRITGSSFPKLAAGPVGQQIHNIYKDRLSRFTDHGQFESQNLQAYALLSVVQFNLPVCRKVAANEMVLQGNVRRACLWRRIHKAFGIFST